MAVQANFKDWPLQPKDLHLETFKEEGRGSYGVVHVGEWRGRSVAVKTVHEVFLKATGQNAKLLEKFKEECYKLRGLEHRRVVRLIDTFRDERGRPLLVMEALEESLESYLLGRVGKLAMVRQITIVNEMAEGLAYLHENKIVHRDLKPANVLVGKDGCIRIADLGQAKLLENIEMLMQTPQPGTVLFLPPEALRGDGSDSYTFSIDCFSLGVIALCVATQSFPTCGLTKIGTVEEAVRRKKDLDKLPTGHPLEAIILGCLQNTPSLRPRSFFIKEHTQALLDKLSLESQLETKSRTVIELRQDLESQKRRADSLEMEKLLENIHLESQLKVTNGTVIKLRQDLDRQKQCADLLRNEKQREKLNLMSQLETRNGTVVQLRKTLESQKLESAECLRKEKHVFENRISALKEDNAKYVDQVRLLQERRVADKAEFEARFLTLQTDAKVKIDSCRDHLTLNLAGILGLLANFDTNLQPFSDCGPNVASKQSSLPTSDNDRLPQQSCADGKSHQGVKTSSSLAHLNRSAVGEQMSHKSHQVPVPLTKSHRKLVVSKGIILHANADIKIVAISSPEGFEVGSNASLDRALDGLLRYTVNRRYQNNRPDKYDVFTVHCPPNSKVNCRFLVVANILDRNLGRRSDAPKYLQQILHSVCREADTLEMPTAAIAPGTFDCGGFPKDSILPTFIKMLNEYNFTNDEFLTEVNVLAMSDDDFSVLVQSAERAVGQPLLQTKADRPMTFVSTPNLAHLPLQPSADGKSSQAAQTRSSLPRQIEPAHSDQMSHESYQVLAKNHRKLIGKKGNILHANADIKIVAISSPEGFEVGSNASLDRALDGLLRYTVNRRYQNNRPDKYDVFTVHCPPNTKANCRFLVVANILDYSLGRRSDAPKYLQQILHSVCREADTLEMPTAAIAPGTFDCGGFPKDSILPAFIKMLNEYNFTNDEFLTEVNVLSMSDDDFSVLVQSAERAVGHPLRQPRNHPPRPPSQPTEGNPATGSSFVGNVASTISSWLRSGSSNDKVQDEPPPQHTRNIPSTPVNLSTSQPAHCSSITMGSKCTLSVELGSTIVEEAIDAVVNPTNGNLDLVGGLSSAINAASRGAVKRECTDLMSRRSGPVPPGCVAVTESGGQLKSKWIIHVNVYDTEETSIQGCSQLLLKSLANVFEVAENKHLSSVALTPFFPRTYGLNLNSEMVARFLIDAIVQSFFPEQSSLKELHLLVDDKQSFITFQKELQTVSSMSTATLPHPDGQSHVKQVQPSRTELNSRNVVQPSSTEPDVFEIPTQSSCRRLVVKKSRFFSEVADIKIVAICSEDHKHSPLNNLNKMLNGALVESITSRYQHGKPSQFDVFTVHCPPDATLQCRFLVVVNILDRKLGQGADSHKLLNQILHNVCREADTLEMPTVAIASGTFDIGGFPRESILPAFVRMISQYNFTNDDFLTDVKFLAANNDAFASLCAVVKRSFGTPEGKLSARSSPSPVGSPTHGAHCSTSSSRDAPNVQVVVGDIVTFVADAVVVPVSPALDLKGIVSEAVNNATHDQLRRKVKNLKINDGDVVAYEKSKFVAGQWKIKAHHLYLLCRSKNTQVDTLKKALAFVLDEATFHKLKSIAFPIPFLSKKVSKTSTADFAMALKDVVTLHQATNPAIVVTVVVSISEASELKDLQESFRNHVVHSVSSDTMYVT